MTFDLDGPAGGARQAAEALARDVAAPAARAVDATLDVPEALRARVRAVLPDHPAAAPVSWVVGVEGLAAASATLAIVAAGAALGQTAVSPKAQWAGLRGADVDGLGAALGADPAWHLAVTAVLVGAGRGAMVAAVGALKAAAAAGASNDAAQPLVADAATSVDAARLLLWDAAARTAGGSGADIARNLARVLALDAVALAMAAAERAAGPDAFRPGTPLERLRRDAATAAMVLGGAAGARAAVAAGLLPA